MVQPDFYRLLVLLLLLLSPALLFSQPDETMPASIPDEIIAAWKLADGTNYAAAITKIKGALPQEYASKITGTSSQADYLTACHWRRVAKLKPYMVDMKKVMYAKHFNLGGGIVGYLEGTSAARGTEWKVGSGLYILTMDNYYPKPEVLLEDPEGVIKDPCVSSDGTYAVFAWWKKGETGGFHIYEIDIATKKVKQITNNPLDLKVGDYEPCILPTGDIVFNSSRIFGIVDCAYNVVSNLYLCNRNGAWLRRIGFDQEHTFHPTMMSDGRVLYSRWEYNDRTRISCGGYFTMNPDGSTQNEYWGNQSDFPLMKYQGREIPKSHGKIMGIAGDHLAPYQGELIVIDPAISRNSNASIKMIAPVRKAPIDPSTATEHLNGNVKYIFQNPWPFDENTCLVSWRPSESEKLFKIYFFDADASHELIAWDKSMSVSQPVVMDAQEISSMPNLQADYTKETGVFTVADVNYGTGSAGVAKGKIAKIRVIGIGPYRTNYSSSTGILGFSVIPIGRPFSSWQVKTLLGEIPVEKDGSAAFTVPANTPVYFQTVDADGRMVNTMRSWSTLMPGEKFDCVGCHEDKNAAPPAMSPIAINAKPLVKRLGIEDKPLSFPKLVQPILDEHCVSCHKAGHKSGLDLRANPTFDNGGKRSFNASYTKLTDTQGKYVDWITQYSKAAPITKFPAPGSGTSPLADKLLKGHKPEGMTPEELEVIFCWIDMMVPHAGAFSEGMSTADSAAHDKYMAENRIKHEEWEMKNKKEFVDAGQWSNAIYQTVAVADPKYPAKTGLLKNSAEELRVIPLNGRLMVQCTGTGSMTLLDMKGRLLMTVKVTDETKTGKQNIALPEVMPSGIYIVRFKSRNVISQRIISSL